MVVVENLSQRQIKQQCMRAFGIRTARSLDWEQGKLSFATRDYLIREDMDILKIEIKERAEIHDALDTATILGEAYKLKITRINKAITVLHLLHSDGLAESIEQEPIHKQL